MSDNSRIGRALDTVFSKLYGALPQYDASVGTLLRQGEVAEGLRGLKELMGAAAPGPSLEAALNAHYDNPDPAQVARAVSGITAGDHSTMLQGIETLARDGYVLDAPEALASTYSTHPLAIDTLEAAELLCGSVISYSDGTETREAVIVKAVAWNKVGNDDQTVATANPGVADSWHGTSRGGYDVALIAAHRPGISGVVTIDEVRPIVEGRVRGKITKKTAIAETYGFLDPRVRGKEVDLGNSNSPLIVTLRGESGDRTDLFGTPYNVVMIGEPRELSQSNASMILGSYELRKVD